MQGYVKDQGRDGYASLRKDQLGLFWRISRTSSACYEIVDSVSGGGTHNLWIAEQSFSARLNHMGLLDEILVEHERESLSAEQMEIVGRHDTWLARNTPSLQSAGAYAVIFSALTTLLGGGAPQVMDKVPYVAAVSGAWGFVAHKVLEHFERKKNKGKALNIGK